LLCKAGVSCFVLAFLAGCAPVLYLPTPADAEQSGTELEALQTGRALYVSHCGSCHNLIVPEKHTLAEWDKNMNEMQEKAHIDDTQRSLIMDYLKTRSKP
jgi:cytochrome c5